MPYAQGIEAKEGAATMNRTNEPVSAIAISPWSETAEGGVARNARLFLCLAVLVLGRLALPRVMAEDSFTIAILPDVQQETSGTRFKDRLTWLVNNRDALNLKIMLQVGDMMNFHLDAHYQHQSEGLKVLDAAKFPYATCIGNHDTAAVREDSGSAAPGNVNQNLRNTTKYNTYFPTTRYQILAGTYEANKIDNAYHTFTAGGLNWLVINLELWARTGAVAWAKTVVAKHPNHNVIFLTHAHLNGDSTIQQNNGGYGDNSPQYVFDQAMKPYANVRLVFCGHVGSHGYREDTGTGGNKIYQFLQCYHDNVNNPTRLLTIDTKNGTMKTWVYVPSTGETKNDGSSRTITGIQWVQPAAPPPPPPPATPAAPTGLKATPVSSSRIDLAWNDVSGNESGFKIERKTGTGGSWAQIATAGANATGYSDTGLASNTLYVYRVRANNPAGDSPYSNEASATTGNKAPTVALTAPANGAAFTAPASVTLTATASDSDGSVTKVEFFSGATKLGEDTSSPYSLTWNDVAVGSYTLSAKATDNHGAVTVSAAASIVVKAAPPPVGNGNGLGGEYYQGMFATPKFYRVDPTIGFDWGTGSPDASMSGDHFSVFWSGQIQAQYSETYTFTTLSDDGVQLWIDGQKIVDHWTDHSPTENSGTATLVAGKKHHIMLNYYEREGGATVKLYWASPSTPRQIVPQSQLYTAPLRIPENPAGTVQGLNYAYCTGIWNALPDFGALAPVKSGTVSDFNLGVRTQNDYFGIRYTGFIDVPYDGMYAFYTNSDDGSRLYLGDRLVVDNDGLHGLQEKSGALGLKAGKHAVTVEYFEQTGSEALSVSWAGPSFAKQLIPVGRLLRVVPANGDGLVGTYFNNENLTGSSVTRIDPTIDFDWGTGSPAGGIDADTFSVRWTGYLVPPASGTYTFTARTDDGVRLWVNGVPVLDNWTMHAVADTSGALSLNAGQKYAIKMEYFEGPVHAVAQLYWTGPGIARQIVPQKHLYTK